MTSPRVLIAGQITHDRYDNDIVAGGCAFYGARTYHALGANVQLVTSVGEDFTCEAALADIPTSYTRGGRTTVFTNTYPAGGVRVQRIETMAPRVPPPGRVDADLVHLAPVMQDIELDAWLDAADGHRIVFAIQGWIKDKGPNETVVQTPWLVEGKQLARASAVALGEEDLIGQGDLLDRLCRHVPVVAFTHGVRGCEVIERGRTTKVGIFKTTEIDPTGAGDTFAAGFFLGLAEGSTPVEAARLGAAASSVVVESRGGSSLHRVGEARRRVAHIEVLT